MKQSLVPDGAANLAHPLIPALPRPAPPCPARLPRLGPQARKSLPLEVPACQSGFASTSSRNLHPSLPSLQAEKSSPLEVPAVEMSSKILLGSSVAATALAALYSL